MSSIFSLMFIISSVSVGWSDIACQVPTDVSTEGDSFVTSDEAQAEIIKNEYQRGLIHYKAERYREALIHFTRVYRVAPHPNLMYNIGVSFERLGEHQNAINYYECYLKLDPQSEKYAEVETVIDTLKRAIKRPEEPPPSGEPRTLAWSGVALGGGAIIGGLILGGRALSLDDDLSAFSRGDSPSRFNAVEEDRDRAALAADLLTISGAVITGVSLYFALREPSAVTSHTEVTAHAERPATLTRSRATFSDLRVGWSLTSLTFSGAF